MSPRADEPIGRARPQRLGGVVDDRHTRRLEQRPQWLDGLRHAEQVRHHQRRRALERQLGERLDVDLPAQRHVHEPDLQARSHGRCGHRPAGVGGNHDLRASTLGGELCEGHSKRLSARRVEGDLFSIEKRRTTHPQPGGGIRAPQHVARLSPADGTAHRRQASEAPGPHRARLIAGWAAR
jgi:hypothetical protein